VDVVRELELEVGTLVDGDDLLRRITAIEPSFARERALALISHRDRSRSRLEARLRDDGYPEDTAAQAVARLADAGLLDDTRLADSLARRFAETELHGRRGVQHQLERRGIPSEVASDVAVRYCPLELEEARATELAHRLVRSSDDERRLSTRLVRRGYAADVARRAASSVLP
jgi:regulatory protein